MKDKILEESLKVVLFYFSATGNTEKIADTIKKNLEVNGVSVTQLDITSCENRQKKTSIREYDAVIFGFPIYSLRAPRICRDWLEQLDGDGKKCSVFFTYGGFGKEPAHYYMKELLEKRNFYLVSTAEFLGAHTFNYSGWRAAIGRPNESDFKIDEEYTIKTLERFRSKDIKVVSSFEKPVFSSEQLDQAEKYRFKLITQLPTRGDKMCSLCMLCENLCPTQSMNALKGEVDSSTCIGCFKCIANCPDNVLHTNNISCEWENKLKMHKTSEQGISKTASKIFL